MQVFKPSEQRTVLGILGGLGPLASAKFLTSIYTQHVSTYPTYPEQQLPTVILYSNPQFPDRTDTLIHGKTQEMLQPTETAIRLLLEAGATQVLMCCFTLHYLLPQINSELCNRMISLPHVALAELIQVDRLALMLCTKGTRRLGIFEADELWPYASRLIVWPDSTSQERIHNLIYKLKAGLNPEIANTIITELCKQYGVDCCVAGCTEFHILSPDSSNGKKAAHAPQFIDALKVIASCF